MPAYTPIIAPADLYTSMYPEVQTLITRGDSTIAVKAISSAISEVKMYLSKYDLVQLFGDPVNNTAATFTDELLNDYVKNIAVWYLLRLANPNVDMSVAVTYYEKAISSLRAIQKGMAQPDGWPYKDTTGETAPQGDSIYSHSNCPNKNFF
jgi:hypothetical protein